ncbi:GATA zinc finger domain-containing protein 14-like [Argonauta hians]
MEDQAYTSNGGMNESGVSEELDILESIYINELTIERHECGSVKQISCQLYPSTGDDVQKQFVCLTLQLALPENYPYNVPAITIKNPRGLGEDELDKLEISLKELANERKGGPMLYELFELAKESLTEGNIPRQHCVICQQNFKEFEEFTRTECYHYFHCHCLGRYVEHCLNDIKEDGASSAVSLDPTKPKESNAAKEVVCPVCREAILYDLDSWLNAPEPIQDEDSFQLSSELISKQEEMAVIFERQRANGGLIDIEAERNKYLISAGECISAIEKETLEDVPPVFYGKQSGKFDKKFRRTPSRGNTSSADDKSASPDYGISSHRHGNQGHGRSGFNDNKGRYFRNKENFNGKNCNSSNRSKWNRTEYTNMEDTSRSFTKGDHPLTKMDDPCSNDKLKNSDLQVQNHQYPYKESNARYNEKQYKKFDANHDSHRHYNKSNYYSNKDTNYFPRKPNHKDKTGFYSNSYHSNSRQGSQEKFAQPHRHSDRSKDVNISHNTANPCPKHEYYNSQEIAVVTSLNRPQHRYSRNYHQNNSKYPDDPSQVPHYSSQTQIHEDNLESQGNKNRPKIKSQNYFHSRKNHYETNDHTRKTPRYNKYEGYDNEKHLSHTRKTHQNDHHFHERHYQSNRRDGHNKQGANNVTPKLQEKEEHAK